MSTVLLKSQMVAAQMGETKCSPSSKTEAYFEAIAKTLVDSLRKEIKCKVTVAGAAGSPGQIKMPGAFSSLQIPEFIAIAKGLLISDGFKVDANGPGTTAYLTGVSQFFVQMATMGTLSLMQGDIAPTGVATGVAIIQHFHMSVDYDSIYNRMMKNLLAAGFGDRGRMCPESQKFHKVIAKSVGFFLTTKPFVAQAPVIGGVPVTSPPATSSGLVSAGPFIY